MNLSEAANFLKMNAESLRQLAKHGKVPGAKIGKCWVFIEQDLADFIRSRYSVQRQAVRVTNTEENKLCHSTAEVRSIGSASPRLMDDEYAKALAL